MVVNYVIILNNSKMILQYFYKKSNITMTCLHNVVHLIQREKERKKGREHKIFKNTSSYGIN